MKPITVLLLVASAFLSLVGRSQTNYIPVRLSVDSAPTNQTDLQSVSSISLQALTPDTSVVGYFADTSSMATYTLVPETQMSTWLQTYINSTYTTSFSDTGKHVYWWIKNLGLSESISSKSVYVHLEASIFMNSFGDSGSQVKIDTIMKFAHPAGADYSQPYQNALLTLIQISAAKASLHPSTTSTGLQIIKKKLLTQTRDYSALPIISDSIVNEGVFVTLRQFAYNNPTITDIIISQDSTKSDGSVIVYHMNDDSTLQTISSLVAVCIGGELYAYRNGHLIAIERTNSSMLISRYRDPDLRVNQALYMRLILRESIGNENPFGIEYTCTTPGYEDAVATSIDLDTGDLSF